MKVKTKSFLLLSAISAVLLAGCAGQNAPIIQEPVYTPAITNLTAVVSPAITNDAGAVTPASTSYTAVVTPPATNFEYQVNPRVQAVLDTAKNIAPLAPAPFAPIATGILALISGGLGLLVKAKNKQLASVQQIADTIQPIIAGVEAAGSPAVKQSIQSYAVAAGVQHVLDPLVQKVTGQLPSSGLAAGAPAASAAVSAP